MKNLRTWQAIAIASQLGFAFAASVAIGIFLGWYLDSLVRTSPVLTILGALLGLAGGVYSCLQIARFLQKGGPSE